MHVALVAFRKLLSLLESLLDLLEVVDRVEVEDLGLGGWLFSWLFSSFAGDGKAGLG
jgi:hypothetical protein